MIPAVMRARGEGGKGGLLCCNQAFKRSNISLYPPTPPRAHLPAIETVLFARNRALAKKTVMIFDHVSTRDDRSNGTPASTGKAAVGPTPNKFKPEARL